MMYIESIKGIPVFIGKYFNAGKISIDDIKEFENILIKSEYFFYNKNKYATKLNSKPALIDFYIKYSKVDIHGNCIYEDELDLPKSIYNEVYKLQVVGGNKINVSIDYINEENLLILNVED